MGLIRTESAIELLYARSRIVMFAVANNLQPIDMVCIDYKNPSVLLKETREGRNMGYVGKQAIHPNQIQVIYDAFRPTLDQFEFAKKIISENEKFQQKGIGAFELNGKMIDMPMVKKKRFLIIYY